MESASLLTTILETSTMNGIERIFAKGERLFSRGDAPRFMFWVQSGEARLVRTSSMGSEIVYQRTRSGFLAEASHDQKAYHCDGVAAMTTRVQAVPIGLFRTAITRPEVQTVWIRHLGRELRRVRAHAERLSLRSAEDRIIHFIETEGIHGELILSQSKKSWASEMGLSHEALYRVLRSMADRGKLTVCGSSLQLKATLHS
ncbi:Crp/Fnr family transcriptional regulator [Rhabdaerophilum sp. SD176]|uniref:Crp/Fnr family transcriptional regulator n=1 Tax=Rhabdaerophilum sp. SD176 TaxID=2983548 RepID=UPI0024DFF725|nr:Crp/Fnr family transcriptional regulator [Rhabdaerophilum sp. SD176]